MKILVDMNLPPEWVEFFAAHGIEAVHWSMVGDSRATDSEIMVWARQRRHVVFTHDLDLGTILATSSAEGPSVIQMRTQDVLPSAVGDDIVRVLTDHRQELERGAIVTVDEVRFRVRILPIMK